MGRGHIGIEANQLIQKEAYEGGTSIEAQRHIELLDTSENQSRSVQP